VAGSFASRTASPLEQGETVEQRYATSPEQLPLFDTAELRERFLVENVFTPGAVTAVYTHHDRIMLGGAMPAGTPLTLPAFDELRAEYFLQLRELGIVNVGETGTVTADGEVYAMPKGACLYIGRGVRDVVFDGGVRQRPRSSTCSPRRRTPPTRRNSSCPARVPFANSVTRCQATAALSTSTSTRTASSHARLSWV
jgi:5-keto 4-deoxyuronate isomerase